MAAKKRCVLEIRPACCTRVCWQYGRMMKGAVLGQIDENDIVRQESLNENRKSRTNNICTVIAINIVRAGLITYSWEYKRQSTLKTFFTNSQHHHVYNVLAEVQATYLPSGWTRRKGFLHCVAVHDTYMTQYVNPIVHMRCCILYKHMGRGRKRRHKNMRK